MSKEFFLRIVILTLLLLTTLGKKQAIGRSALITHDVFPGGSIQNAIDSALPGDTVFVHAGLYYANVLVDKPLNLIGEEKHSTVIDGNKTDDVIKVIASNAVVSGFTVQNSNSTIGSSYAGIKILGQTCNITGNHATNNRIGIFATSQRSRIAENIVDNNGQGITLYASSEVTVEANNVSANTVGISLAYSSENLVVDNSATSSLPGGHGITVSSNSFNNTILRNELANNYHGIWLSSSTNNWILENTIADNILLGIELASSSSNTIYHNTLVNNQKHIVIDNQTVSIWSSASEGNFWSDYTGVDLDGDGIGDTSYMINLDNQDDYPLITPFAWDYSKPVPVIWNGVIYPVELSSNSTISEFRFNQPQAQISFNASGTSGTVGFCNISIPKALLRDNPWNISVTGQPLQDFAQAANSTHSILHFTYNCSETSHISIQGTLAIPELSHTTIVSVLIVTLLAVVICKRRRDQTKLHTCQTQSSTHQPSKLSFRMHNVPTV